MGIGGSSLAQCGSAAGRKAGDSERYMLVAHQSQPLTELDGLVPRPGG